MANDPKEYLVTDASFYTVHPEYPVIAKYRFQLIEEIKPQPKGGKFWKFCKDVFQSLALGFCALIAIGFLVGLVGAIFGH